VGFLGGIRAVARGGGEVRGRGEGLKDAAVEGERDLNFSFIRVAVYHRCAGGGLVFRAHGW